MSTESTTHKFQAEVSELLRLVVHSLYSNKEIFLRELVSNASDALDRLRFRALTEPSLLPSDTQLAIRILPDKERGTLTFEDNGVGMTEQELVDNLGTIARSGSRAFLQHLAANGGAADLKLIGQFGVGFYSSYLVADRVEVISRAAGSEQAARWASDARESFEVGPAERASQGTSVVLHLRKEHHEFLEDWRLRALVTRYSDFVGHPIVLAVPEKEPQTLNQGTALWLRTPKDVTAEQYNELYKHLTHDQEEPFGRAHFTIEGAQQFTALLFVPKAPDPFDLYDNQKKQGVRLFVRRVFILEDVTELLPQWLRFVRGIVDSDDLPLNVSRELLQDSATVRGIKKQLTKKVLDLLDDAAKERPGDYNDFFKNFGAIFKSGLAQDFEYRERLAALVRFPSSHGEGLTSLAEYVARMKPEQKAIYYVSGESKTVVAAAPHVEGLRARGYEVLYLLEPVDEIAIDSLRTFDGKPLVSAARSDLDLEQTEEQKKEAETRKGELAGLLEHMQKVLGEHVREVRPSDRLTDSPACLVVEGHGTSAYLERLLKERGHAVPRAKRILELNAKHPLIEQLRKLHAEAPASPKLTEWVELLHDQALLTEGSPIEDPQRFARRMTELMAAAVQASANPST